MSSSLGVSLVTHIQAEDDIGKRLLELVHRHGVEGLERAVAPSNFEMVREFHRAFNVEEAASPTLDIPEKIAQLRFGLIDEERAELEEAFGEYQLEGTLKELCDLLYVVYGLGAVLGFDVDAAFSLVHDSNMSKLGRNSKPIMRADGKVMKSELYTPADLSALL